MKIQRFSQPCVFLPFIFTILLTSCVHLNSNRNNISPTFRPSEMTKSKTPTHTPMPTEVYCPPITAIGVNESFIIERTKQDMGALTYIFLFKSLHKEWKQIVEGDISYSFPSLSHDKQKLIHIKNTSMNKAYIIITDITITSTGELDNTGETNTIYTSSGYISSKPRWSYDDKWIAFSISERHKESKIIVLNIESGNYFHVESQSAWNDIPIWNSLSNELLFLGGDFLRANTIYSITVEDIMEKKQPLILLHNDNADYNYEMEMNKQGKIAIIENVNNLASGIIIIDRKTNIAELTLMNEHTFITSIKWSTNGEILTFLKIIKRDEDYDAKLSFLLYGKKEVWTITTWNTKTPWKISYVWSKKKNEIAVVKGDKIGNTINYRYWMGIINIDNIIASDVMCPKNIEGINLIIEQQVIIHDWIE